MAQTLLLTIAATLAVLYHANPSLTTQSQLPNSGVSPSEVVEDGIKSDRPDSSVPTVVLVPTHL